MKKWILSIVAMTAFVVTFAGTMASHLTASEEAWFHVTDTNFSNPMEEPRCIALGEELCAVKYEREDENSPWVPSTDPGSEAYGIPF